MQKGIAEINISDSDELRLKKINENFKNLVTGKTPVGAVSTSGGMYSGFVGSVGGTLSTNPSFGSSFSNYIISAQYITAKKIGADQVAADVVNTRLANISSLDVERIWAATVNATQINAVKANIAGTLSAVTIQGDWIAANTLSADKIMLRSGNIINLEQFVTGVGGLFNIINKSGFESDADYQRYLEGIIGLSPGDEGYEEAKNKVLEEFDKTIDGNSVIRVGSLTAKHIVVTDLEAFGADIAGFKFLPRDEETGEGGGLLGQVGSGLIELRPNGYFRAGKSTGTYIEVDPDNDRLDMHCSTLRAEEDITHNDIWKWDLTQNGALNLLYIGPTS